MTISELLKTIGKLHGSHIISPNAQQGGVEILGCGENFTNVQGWMPPKHFYRR